MTWFSSIGRRITYLLVASLCIAASAPAMADDQSDRIQELEKRLARSLQLIEQLSSRITQLENAARHQRHVAAAAPPASAPASAPSPASTAATVEEQGKSIAALQESVSQMANGLSRHPDDTGIALHGFIDVDAAWSSKDDPAKLRGFSAGSLDLYVTPQIGPRVKSLLELVVEVDEEGSSVDMERIQIGYTFSDAFTVWAGRFHTPFGLWNTSFHHGANLQTSISRPTFVDFEDRGGLIPAHSVGLWATGRTRLDAGKITYDAYLANGPSIRERSLDPNTFTDDGSNKLVGFNLGYQAVGAMRGLTVGVHGFGSKVQAYSSGNVLQGTTRLRALGGYLGYDAYDWEAFGEYYRLQDSQVGEDVSRSSNAGFLHVGRSFGAWTPFVRYERASLNPDDLYFRSLRNGRAYTHLVLGTRYALDANSSLKFELRSAREAAFSAIDENGIALNVPAVDYRRALLQFSIAF